LQQNNASLQFGRAGGGLGTRLIDQLRVMYVRTYARWTKKASSTQDDVTGCQRTSRWRFRILAFWVCSRILWKGRSLNP